MHARMDKFFSCSLVRDFDNVTYTHTHTIHKREISACHPTRYNNNHNNYCISYPRIEPFDIGVAKIPLSLF